MLTVLNCIATEHDFRLVVLAIAICTLASLTTISLLHHQRRSQTRKVAWLVVAAATAGSGTWATHFIAMLAYTTPVPATYGIGLTVISLLAAIAIMGLGFQIALSQHGQAVRWIGGAIVGGGIAIMHYTGMAAFDPGALMFWDRVFVVASVMIGMLLGAAAMATGLRDNSAQSTALGGLLLTLAIGGLHFTAMSALTVVPDPIVDHSQAVFPQGGLAVAVAIASVAIILLALASQALDLRARRHALRELERMRGLANAAVEGLIVCDRDTITTANHSFSHFVGCPDGYPAGRRLEEFFPDGATRLKLISRPDHPFETMLMLADGRTAPVEVILRPVDYGGKPQFAIAVRDLRARKQAENEIRFLAHHDALTGLPNRSSFNKKLDQEIANAVANDKKLAVLFLDLDRFKEINDVFGHSAGDALLQNVAIRITSVLEQDQMVSRMGGDEFAIIMPDVNGPAAAGRLAENIIDALNADSETGSADAANCSIGIAICPDDGVDRKSLLNHADTALYRSKSEGRGPYRFFEAAMGAEVRERRRLEQDLRHAIGRGEMKLVYQPQSNIVSGDIFGLEALLRWEHPERGEVMPGDFIPIAEESGTIMQIGEWVLETACREAAGWERPLAIAVNVSPVQIHNSNFARCVHRILLQTGLAPARLEIEITETAMVRDLNRALATLRQLKALGVRIAMDDFGTGYSSLSNLRAFPFDKIKIDASFVRSVQSNEQTATIVRAVLGLGRGLGLPVLAEGVETTAELRFLADEECDQAQGYLFGRPADIESFRHLTHGHQEKPGRKAVATGQGLRVVG